MAIRGRKRKLKPCPLCESPAQLDEIENATNDRKYYIHCTACVITTWCYYEDDIPHLCSKWNNRKEK